MEKEKWRCFIRSTKNTSPVRPASSRSSAGKTAKNSSATPATTAISRDSRTPMAIDKQHLLPNHHPAPLYATVPKAEYDALKRKLDICQKECIRIAELYQRDQQLFHNKIKRIIRHINEAKRNYVARKPVQF